MLYDACARHVVQHLQHDAARDGRSAAVHRWWSRIPLWPEPVQDEANVIAPATLVRAVIRMVDAKIRRPRECKDVVVEVAGSMLFAPSALFAREERNGAEN